MLEYYYHFLMSDIKNAIGVCAILGCLMAENDCKTISSRAVERAKCVGFTADQYIEDVKLGKISREKFASDRVGFGMAQWTHPERKANLYDYLTKHHYCIDCERGQIEFVLAEIKKYKKLWIELLNSDDIETCTTSVLQTYEKPKNMRKAECIAKRVSCAKKILSQFS